MAHNAGTNAGAVRCPTSQWRHSPAAVGQKQTRNSIFGAGNWNIAFPIVGMNNDAWNHSAHRSNPRSHRRDTDLAALERLGLLSGRRHRHDSGYRAHSASARPAVTPVVTTKKRPARAGLFYAGDTVAVQPKRALHGTVRCATQRPVWCASDGAATGLNDGSQPIGTLRSCGVGGFRSRACLAPARRRPEPA